MSEAPNFMKFHFGDYARDCEELSMLQHGAYFNLMRWYYTTARPIPNELERIYRRVGAYSAEERASVQYVLENFFVLDGPVWRHKRIDLELVEWRERSELARQSVARREEKRRKINASTSSIDMPSMSVRSSNQNQNQINNKGPSATLLPSLPDWLPARTWEEFRRHRVAIKKRMTDLAESQTLKELDRLRRDGHDPVAVIEQSIQRGWAGVFPLKADAAGGPSSSHPPVGRAAL